MNKIQNKWLDEIPLDDLLKKRAVAGYVVIDASREKSIELAKVGFVFLVAVFLCSIGGFHLAMLGLAIVALAGKMAYDALGGVWESSDFSLEEKDFLIYLQGREIKKKRQAAPCKTG